MQTHLVESTTLASIAYEAAAQLLHLQFRDRKVYTYFEVPAEVYEALLQAPSKGQYFNKHVRDQFYYRRREESS